MQLRLRRCCLHSPGLVGAPMKVEYDAVAAVFTVTMSRADAFTLSCSLNSGAETLEKHAWHDYEMASAAVLQELADDIDAAAEENT